VISGSILAPSTDISPFFFPGIDVPSATYLRSRESVGMQPGTSGLQRRIPATSTITSMSMEGVGNHDNYQYDNLCYEEISREEHLRTMSDGTVVSETATTVVVNEGSQVNELTRKLNLVNCY
jgi:hypothetical protein